ncbi:MAG: eL32 family ribosomal protein, partial [Promethearchaeota archaeon]
ATRQKKKNGVKSPNVGYRAPKKVRSLHPSGLIPVKVTRLEDLDGLKRKVHGIIIDSHLGIKKRQKLVEAIQNKHFRILNMGIPYEERLKEK